MPRLHTILRHAVIAACCLVALSGCNENSRSCRDIWGKPQHSKLLAPFAGEWAFDFEKTLDARKAAGVTDDEITRTRKRYADHPGSPPIHEDISINGHVALSAGFPTREYRFFAVHQHGEKVCGKAWDHENRNDPGDMVKCYVRLMLKDDCLHLNLRWAEGFGDPDDQDLRRSPPVEHGSPDDCDADSPPGEDWQPWETYVFVRKQ